MASQAKVLRAENNRLDKQLNKCNRDVLTDMVVYIRSFYLSEYQEEMVRHDITHMILDGQLRGDDIKSIIGEDYKVFCDEILHEVPERKPLYTCLSAISLICLLKVILIVIWFGFSVGEVFGGDKTWPYVPIYIGAMVSALFIIAMAIFIVFYIGRKSFDKMHHKKVIGFVCMLMFVTVLAGAFSNLVINEAPIMNLHVGVIVGIVVLLLVVYKGLDMYIEKKEMGA